MTKNNKHQYKDINSELIGRCRIGDRKAQFEIYKLYYKAMYNTCLRIVNNSQEAEDIMQESFLKAFRNLDQFKGEVSFGAWLKKIVVNKSLDQIRKRKMLFDKIEDLDNEPAAGIHEDQSEIPVFSVAEIREEIENLPEGFRIVLSLYLLEGYDHEEISQILKITASTSRSQYARARKKLIENLKKKKNEQTG